MGPRDYTGPFFYFGRIYHVYFYFLFILTFFSQNFLSRFLGFLYDPISILCANITWFFELQKSLHVMYISYRVIYNVCSMITNFNDQTSITSYMHHTTSMMSNYNLIHFTIKIRFKSSIWLPIPIITIITTVIQWFGDIMVILH